RGDIGVGRTGHLITPNDRRGDVGAVIDSHPTRSACWSSQRASSLVGISTRLPSRTIFSSGSTFALNTSAEIPRHAQASEMLSANRGGSGRAIGELIAPPPRRR